ncbi:MAG TPA: nuclear transport factor 2 family protein [Candidatus Dormibacteraeota bacterium]|nr:nuclear transport factor 2 family protein [Candidatus Dormibacteraeota bacterium]
MTEANLELVFDHLDARRSRDLVRLESQLDPEVVHQGVLPELVCNNRDEVLANVQRSFARTEFGVDRLEMIDAGDRVVVGLAGPRFRDVPGTPIDGQIYMVYTLREGRIVRMDDFLSRSDAMKAAGSTGRDWT